MLLSTQVGQQHETVRKKINNMTWQQKLRSQLKHDKRTIENFMNSLGLDRKVIYHWDDGKLPYDKHISAIAKAAGMKESTLRAELNPTQVVDPSFYMDAAAARRDASLLYQNLVDSMADAVALTSDTGYARPTGVDVVARVVREALVDEKETGTPPAVTILPIRRGSHPGRPFHYLIAVTPWRLLGAGKLPADAPVELSKIRVKIDKALEKMLLPVTREHSLELVPEVYRGRSDVLLYPALLEPRAGSAEPVAPGSDVRSMLVCGVFQSGAPDIASLIAKEEKRGFARVEHLARASISAGLGTVDNEVLHNMMPRALAAVLRRRETVTGAAVWAVDDVEPLLDGTLLDQLTDYTGRFLVVTLDNEGLTYAGELIEQDHGPPLGRTGHDHWRSVLEEWQKKLLAVIEDLKARPSDCQPWTVKIKFPSTIVRGKDGKWPDAVDKMFDAYRSTSMRVLAELRDLERMG